MDKEENVVDLEFAQSVPVAKVWLIVKIEFCSFRTFKH